MTSKLNLHQNNSITLIQSYSAGKLQIKNTEHTGNLIVTPDKVFGWELKDLNHLNADDFSVLFKLGYSPELVLLGTGNTLKFPRAEQTSALIKAQIGLEVMDTAAACRTYNILADDGRRVVAYLVV